MLPNSGPILLHHMYDCDLNGPLGSVESPVVVWRDGGFSVVETVNDGEQIYDIGFERISHEIELPILDVDLVDGVNVEPVETIMSLSQEDEETPEEE
jgi:hypothetical protein